MTPPLGAAVKEERRFGCHNQGVRLPSSRERPGRLLNFLQLKMILLKTSIVLRLKIPALDPSRVIPGSGSATRWLTQTWCVFILRKGE